MPLSYNLKRDRDAAQLRAWHASDKDPFAQIGCDRQNVLRLQSSIRGRVVLPGDPDYDSDRMLSNPLFDQHPQIIVYCKGTHDVVAALQTARECGLNVRARSGGHSTAGYSTGPGMLLDVRNMDSSPVYSPHGPAAPVARVEPGCAFGELNDTLNLYDLHVPGGGCPDVCAAGYMQGGGFGFTSRMFGINCDRVIGATMVRADGQIVRANSKENPDLYWAIRGGTGNQFGVLTEIDYSLVPLSRVWGFSLAWPLGTAQEIAQAAQGLAVMQAQYMAGDENGDIGYMTIICGQSDGTPEQADGSHLKPYLLMKGMIVGEALDQGEDYLMSRLDPLTETGAQYQWHRFDTYNRMNYDLLSQPNEIPDFPKGTPMPFEDKDARYIGAGTVLTEADWAGLIDLVVNQAPNPFYCLVIEPYGGVISKVGKLDTAFIHRDVACDVFLDGFWWDDAGKPPVMAWLKTFETFMKPFWNGHVYQNYPNGNLEDYRWNYFGDAFPTLLKVKETYDPDNMFAFPQSISPIPEGVTGLTRSSAAPLSFASGIMV